ncbi:MAG: serine protein kinase RIO [Fervidicoccaceae archaeon]
MEEEDMERRIDRELYDEEKREKDYDLLKTVEEVFDSFTIRSLYELARKVNIRKITGVISSGKEARIYRGIDREGQELAIKIYLTFSAEFKKSISKYIVGDERFEKAKITSTRKLMSLWAKKEYSNLKKMFSSGVRVPKPIAQRDNIVVMEFIGKDGNRAPLLKEIGGNLEDPQRIYEEILENVKKMVCKGELVHADLSEYNIMIFEGTPVIIDVSQSVLLSHPNAEEFLKKDIMNIDRFFKRTHGIKPIGETILEEELLECLKKEREELYLSKYSNRSHQRE